jgi:hypothetical protein
MACEDFQIGDPELPDRIAHEVLESVKIAVTAAGLKAVPRAYVSVGPVPAEDCCPDLVVWVSNIRLWDSNSPDTLQESRVLAHFGVAFDINVRIGDCFFEVNDKGVPFPPAQIGKMSTKINQYGYAMFLGVVNAITALSQCGLNVSPRNADPYNDGACAGFQASFSVSVI